MRIGRVGIDAHCLSYKKTGNETYTHNLVKSLSQLPQEGLEYVVYVNHADSLAEDVLREPHVHTKLIRPASPFIRIPVGFALQSRSENLDVFHAQYLLPHHLRCRTVLTVFDILYERYPQFFTNMEYMRLKIGVPWSCRNADHVITISHASKRDLIEHYRLDPASVSVTYLAAADCYRPIDKAAAKEHLRRKYKIDDEFILYVGAIQPRKNIPRLLAAFAELKRKQNLPHKLVLAGPKAWLSKESFQALQDHPFKEEIIVPGYVAGEDLPYFYNAATVFVYVSICEGFGLPVIEAMACGTPTITSRGSSLEEIAGGAAILVDPYDGQAIESAMDKVLSDGRLRDDLGGRGLARSQQFTFRRMAEQTQAIYQQLMS